MWLSDNFNVQRLVTGVRFKYGPIEFVARRAKPSITGNFFSHFLSHMANDLNRRGADVKAFDGVTCSK